MPFANFLAKVQWIINLYDQIGESYLESAKLRFLFNKVQSVNLKHSLKAVRTVVSMSLDAFNFTSAANNLSSLAKPRSKCELSAITSSEDSGGNSSEIMKNGKIFTDYYPNWRQISKELLDEMFIVDEFSKGSISSCRVTSVPKVSNVVAANLPTSNTFVSGDRKLDALPQSSADQLLIALDTAKQTLEKTTQRLVRSALLPLSWQYKADRIFQWPRFRGHGFQAQLTVGKSQRMETDTRIFLQMKLILLPSTPWIQKEKQETRWDHFVKSLESVHGLLLTVWWSKPEKIRNSCGMFE